MLKRARLFMVAAALVVAWTTSDAWANGRGGGGGGRCPLLAEVPARVLVRRLRRARSSRGSRRPG